MATRERFYEKHYGPIFFSSSGASFWPLNNEHPDAERPSDDPVPPDDQEEEEIGIGGHPATNAGQFFQVCIPVLCVRESMCVCGFA